MRSTGPFFSLAASGTFANTFTAGQWRGRQWLRKRTTPKRTLTQKQRRQRTMIGFLQQAWSQLSQADQDKWDAEESSVLLSPYHAFIQANALRWSAGNGPILYPGIVVAPYADIQINNAVGGVGQATVSLHGGNIAFLWGAILLGELTTSPGDKLANTIRVYNINFDPALWTAPFTIDNLAPGNWLLNVRGFNGTGTIYGVSAADTAVTIT